MSKKYLFFLIPVVAILAFLFQNCGPGLQTNMLVGDSGDTRDQLVIASSLTPPKNIDTIPEIIICQNQPDPYNVFSESTVDETFVFSCKQKCRDWRRCIRNLTIRNVEQSEFDFVVNEDGQGRGFAGTLRFTSRGDFKNLVFVHKGGSGTEWVDDILPAFIERSGGVAAQPKWIDKGMGWFSRPFANSKIEHSLAGISLRPAAVLKWIYFNLTNQVKFSSAACSGGSMATYYPRHWHGLDYVFKYQLLAGGPVMSRINPGCGSESEGAGRCELNPQKECSRSRNLCRQDEGSCNMYEWGRGATMTAVRLSMDSLHSSKGQCKDRAYFDGFGISNFDKSNKTFDQLNEHQIDFLLNVGPENNSDSDLGIVSHSALIFSGLQGPKNWIPVASGEHCDGLYSEVGFELLRKSIFRK